MTAFLHVLWEHLCSRSNYDGHLCLTRTAQARPITGDPITGWRF